MSKIDFDRVLEMVGDRGRYQTIMFIILCIPATIPVAFLAFSNVFTNATPDHWCKPPPKYNKFNLSVADLKYLTIPFRIRGDGEKIYSKCTMYDTESVDILSIVGAIDNNRTFPRESDTYSGGNNYHFENVKNCNLSEVLSSNETFSLSSTWKTKFEDLLNIGTLKSVSCKYGWSFDKTYYEETLVTQFNLVCDNNWWPQTSTALFYVGSLFGNVFFGWVADRWGRRIAMLWMIALEVLLSIATCFSADYQTYVVFRALGGLLFPSLYQIPLIIGIEMMGSSHRTFAGMLICMFFAAGMSLLALLAYLIRDWYHLSVVTSFPFIILFSYYWIIPESPRWLVSQGRLDEAEEILQTMAKYNGNKIPKRLLQTIHEEMDPQLQPKEVDDKKLLPQNMNGNLNFKPDVQIRSINTRNLQNNDIYTKKSNSEQYDKTKVMQLRKNLLDDSKEPVDYWPLKRPSTYPAANNVTQIIREKSKVVGFINNKDDDNQKSAHDNEESDKYNLIDNAGTTDDPIITKGGNGRSGEEIEKDDDDMSCLKTMKSVCLQTDPVKVVEKQEATMLDIFRYPNIRKKFFLLTFDWIANAVVYNGLSYNATNLGVNDFLAFFIAAAIEIPSYLLAWWFMERWGRRWVLSITLATGGLGCLSCMFVPEERVWVTVVLAMIGKFGVAASFSVFYVFVGELFPTVLRSQAMGLASLLVSVGLLSFPYILQLGHYSRVLPLIILGILSLSGSVASIFLPETLNTPMPQTLEDGENFGKDFKIFSVPKRCVLRKNKNKDFDKC